MQRLLTLAFIVMPLFARSQKITGKLYDDKTIVKNVKILNVGMNTQTHSDENGGFKISAAIGDSLVFRSIFYSEKTLVVNQGHFNQTIVVQLKKVVNELDEVLLAEKPKFKPFDAEKHEADFKAQLENDKKNRPYLYNNYRSGGIDFISIANAIVKLFKRKNRPDTLSHV